MPKAQAQPRIGVVSAVSEYQGEPSGIKLGHGDDQTDWLNFSKPEWREKPFDIPDKGDKVQVMLRYSNDKAYIQSIEILDGHPRGPAWDEEPKWDEPPPEYDYSERNPGGELKVRIDPRQQSIVRQSSLKSAAEIIAHRTGLTFADGDELAAYWLALAARAEEWANR